MDYIKAGKDEGAKVVLGGERHGNEGYFIQPTVFTEVNEKMKIMQEEIFGPVVAIGKFKDVEDCLQKAHDTFYGLAASVHTKNLNTAIEVSNRLQAGSVWVNCHNFLSHQLPFGGFKQSGIGRELGYDLFAKPWTNDLGNTPFPITRTSSQSTSILRLAHLSKICY
jgi:aldehyde dehydrogenase (NAD+)